MMNERIEYITDIFITINMVLVLEQDIYRLQVYSIHE